jgi:hypothetical protein
MECGQGHARAWSTRRVCGWRRDMFIEVFGGSSLLRVVVRLALYLPLACLTAFLFNAYLTPELAYYAILFWPLLFLWVVAGVVIAVANLDWGVRRVYLLANAGAIATTPVIWTPLIIEAFVSPRTSAWVPGSAWAPITFVGLVVGLLMGFFAGRPGAKSGNNSVGVLSSGVTEPPTQH